MGSGKLFVARGGLAGGVPVPDGVGLGAITACIRALREGVRQADRGSSRRRERLHIFQCWSYGSTAETRVP